MVHFSRDVITTKQIMEGEPGQEPDPEDMADLSSSSEEDDEDPMRNLMDEVNWEEQRLVIYNENMLRRRMRDLRGVNANEAVDENDDEEVEQAVEEVESSDNEEPGPDNESFDTELPTRHAYLGEAREVAGRTILEEDLIQDLPVISRPGIILMPGQTLPLTLFQPTAISMMRKLIDTTKTFGIIHHRYRPSHPGLIEEANIGTTAEIYEFREPSPESLEVGLKIKAKGRQRFRVLNQRRQVDGNKIATVEILREVELPDPLYEIRLLSRDRLRPHYEDSLVRESGEAGASRPRDKSKERENKAEFLPPAIAYRSSKMNHLRTRVYNVPLTPFPYWVYEQYDAKILVERVHELLGKLRLFSQTEVIVPRDPKELSFWVASNLPLDDSHRLHLLEIGCAIPRLRCEISLMERCHVLCCRNCGEEISKQEDIFSMSREGPQGAYVNPGGYVHETLTLYKAKNLTLVGDSSTEYSWFPGYAWTICQCRYCDSHMGWKFTASSSKLAPRKFWGLSRRSIRPQLEMSSFDKPDEFRPLM